MKRSFSRTLRTLQLVAAFALVGAIRSSAAASEAETRKFYWEDVFGFPDCVWQCDYNHPVSGCLTDPNCRCTCFQ